jgi:hypothetical protein
MIDELDETLRRFLIRELPIQNGEVDIAFDQPKREWSARVSRPTLNVFLYDVVENQKLRQTQPLWETEHNPDGTATQRRKPVRMDLHYMITAWATDPEDEHRLLSRCLMALFRFSTLPEELLSEGLQAQGRPLPILVAQTGEMSNPTDVWNVLDNEMHPAITCTVTLALDPYTPQTVPLVRTRELQFGQSGRPITQNLDAGQNPDEFWSIGGHLNSQKPLDLEKLRLTLVEQGRSVPVLANGQFTIGRLKAGAYTLEITVGSDSARRYPIHVPSSDYELEV